MSERYIRKHPSRHMEGLGELKGVRERAAVVLRQDGSVDVYGDIAVVDQTAQPAQVGYTVSFEYTVEDVTGPLEAAMQTYGTLTDPQSMRPIATVINPDGKREEIDLEVEDKRAEAARP